MGTKRVSDDAAQPAVGLMTFDVLAAARWFVKARGFSVIPLDHPDDTQETDPKRVGKVPRIRWEVFQRVKPTDDNLIAWFGNGRASNLAIVTGVVSRIVSIDGDSPDALAWMRAHLPETEMRTRTGRGEHWFYQHPGPHVFNKARLCIDGSALEIDLRGDGGYVVAPTAKHVSGVYYEPLGSWPPIDELPVFDPAWIAPEPTHPHPSTRADSPAVERSTDRDHLLRRAQRYLAETPGAVEGQGGDQHTFVVACRLVRDFGLDEAEALELLREWNGRCAPPWDERDLETKIANAARYGRGSLGAKIEERRPLPPVQTPTPQGESVPVPIARVFNATDSGNAEYLAWRHGRDVRFDFRRGRYLLWQGHRWQPDADAEIRRLAKSAMRQRFRDAATLDDPDARSRAAKWATSSESRGRLDALLYLAQAEPPIADAGTAWDTDPVLLGAPNGTVDLRTGTLRAARRDDRITLSAGVDYDGDARSTLWDTALRTILLDDNVIDFFQVAIGYSATGDTRRDCWFLANGSGRNGKGTLLQPIRHALGDYALELPGSVFDLRSERSPYELAYLPGKRFVTSSEAGDTIRLHHDRVKQLTGGDSMSAANKYEKGFEFEPVCKLWLACNKRPRVTDDTAAFWARVFLIPFVVSFVGKEDRSLRPALVTEPAHQAAVLAWIVRGAVRYYAEGLEPPASIRAATEAYREASDPLSAFLDEACELEPAADVAATELYEHYARWADAQHFSAKERLSATMFGRLMSGRFEGEHTRAGKVYRGVARRPL